MGWENTPLGSILEKHLKLPVSIQSDVIAGACGEYHFGSARDKRSFLYISIGTGIGGAYFIDGKLLRTANEAILNIGHISVAVDGESCGCGNKGCLEQYISGSAIVRRVNREREGAATSLNEKRHPHESVSLKEIYHAARSGDDYTQKVLLEAGTYLGAGIVNMINLFGPGTIVIGGGVSLLEDCLMERAREVVSQRVKSYLLDRTEIVAASHPQQAGILGAACAALEQKYE
jgi:glucokinase